MITYAQRALRDVLRLRDYYEDKDRPEAIQKLAACLAEAEALLARDPMVGLAFPRPYPGLRKAGRLWVKAGPYWVAYAPGKTIVILGVFHDRANIRGRAVVPQFEIDTGA